tara:strand:+ start:184 stop:441 length:258 start_codon:yes stop_codon:yes gene_type:complete
MKITDILDAKLNLELEHMDLEHNQKGIMEELKQLHSEMEEDAEPEGGPICDQYADAIHRKERELEKITREMQVIKNKIEELENLI